VFSTLYSLTCVDHTQGALTNIYLGWLFSLNCLFSLGTDSRVLAQLEHESTVW
jgi:hypothetical protein